MNLEKSVLYIPGDVILEKCAPLFTVILKAYQDTYCSFCFKSKPNLVTCTCNILKYCKERCRSRDMARGHEVECQSACYQGFCQEGDDADNRRALFRIYSQLKMKPAFGKSLLELCAGRWRCFNELICSPLLIDDRILATGREMAEAILQSDRYSRVQIIDLLTYLSIMKTNGVKFYSKDGQNTIGWGLYFEPTEFRHSCKPTAIHCHIGQNLQIRAIAIIPVGQLPTLCYHKTPMEMEARQTVLKKAYKVFCHCSTCRYEPFTVGRYEALNSMIYELKVLNESSVIAEALEWFDIYRLHRVIIDDMLKIYHKYDDRITNQLLIGLKLAMRLKSATKLVLDDMVVQCKENLRITYGKDHALSKYFVEFIMPIYNQICLEALFGSNTVVCCVGS